MHSNMCVADSAKAHFMTLIGAFIPSLIIDNEHYSKMYPLTDKFTYIMTESGYMHLQATKPDTIGK